MKTILIVRERVVVANLELPSFHLDHGSFLCLHLPGPGGGEEEVILQFLTGLRPLPGLQLHGQVLPAPWATERKTLWAWLRPLRAVDWLRQQTGMKQAEAEAIVQRLGLPLSILLRQLAGTPRALLGLEAAWARGAEGVVFYTAGLDPAGVRTVYQAVAAHLPFCAAMHLSREFHQCGQVKRDCFGEAVCLPVQRIASPAPLASAVRES